MPYKIRCWCDKLRIKTDSENRPSPTTADVSKNVIVRNLSDVRNENLKLKVLALFIE